MVGVSIRAVFGLVAWALLLTQLTGCQARERSKSVSPVKVDVPIPVERQKPAVVEALEKNASHELKHTDSIHTSHLLPTLVVAWHRQGTEEDSVLMMPRTHAVSERSVAVVDAAKYAIVVLNLKNGAIVNEFGRKGHGPGEFADVDGVSFLTPDTIVAFDRQNSAIKLFSPSGQLLAVHAANIFSLSSSCNLSKEGLWLALIGKEDLTKVDMHGAIVSTVHRLWPEQEETRGLLRAPLLLPNPAQGTCIAVQPYGGRIAEFADTVVLRRARLYHAERPVKIRGRGNRAEGTEFRTIMGQPTIDDVCLSSNKLFLLRSTSEGTKVLDVFAFKNFEYEGSLPIDKNTIAIGCSSSVLVAKEYVAGLFHFTAYTIVFP